MKWASVVLVAALLTPAFALASAERPACCRAMAGGGMACCPAGDGGGSDGLQLRSCSSSSDFAPAPSAARAEIPAASMPATLVSSAAPSLLESADLSSPAIDPPVPPPRG